MEKIITQTGSGKRPLCIETLSKEQLHAQLQKGYDDIAAGRLFTEDEVFEGLRKDLGINVDD